MRAHTEGKYEMGTRFAIVIGVAVAGVMALGAQTATAGGESVDSTPPDLQLSGKKKQKLGNAVKVKASCGDEACHVGSDSAKLTNLGGVADRREGWGEVLKTLKPAHADLAPGETTTLALKLTGRKATRKLARTALAEGRNVQAKITVTATDAAGNVAIAKRTIKLVK